MLITKGILYDAKDNELLLSLPIEDKYIILARMINVFANAIIYTSLVWIPMIVHSQIYLGFNVLNLIYGIITLILLTLTVTALSCLFGHLIARLTRKVKKKNLVTTVLTLVLLGLYYYVYFNANRYLTALLMYKDKFISFLNTKGILLSVLGKAVTGNSISLLIATGIYLVITVLGFLLILPNYRKQLIATPAFAKKEFKGNYSKQSSVANTLISREVKLFFSNATYTLNCGLGVIILVGGAIALIIFKGKIDELLPLLDILPIVKTVLPILLLCAILLIVGMDALSVPAVSLEGKNYWIVRSLPISTYDILNSKRLLQFRMHVVPSVLLALVCTFIFKIDDMTQAIMKELKQYSKDLNEEIKLDTKKVAKEAVKELKATSLSIKQEYEENLSNIKKDKKKTLKFIKDKFESQIEGAKDEIKDILDELRKEKSEKVAE